MNGRITIRRTIYKDITGTSVVPVDQWLGIADSSYSVGTRELCCRMARCCSFKDAQNNIKRLAQLDISATTISKLAYSQGEKIALQQVRGDIKANFTHDSCIDNTIITGTDGVMVPMVTEQQKSKRRQTEKAKRSKEKRKSTARRGRPKKGSDGAYREFKIVIFYSKDKEYQYAVGTCGNHEKLGSVMRREGLRIGIHKAEHKYSITDGASWILKQYKIQLPMLDENILDYYHLKEHVKQVATVLYGDATPEALSWREDLMTTVYTQGPLVMLERIKEITRTLRSKIKKQAIDSLYQYVAKRITMTDYPTYQANGYDCGSGPTESVCGNFTHRLKGSGMRWDKDNAQKMMNLESIYFSGQWDKYWAIERAS